MTEQPTSGYDEAHRGYQPPPYRPPYGGDGHVPPMPTAAPHLGQPAGSYAAYGQPAGPYADAYGQPYYYGVAPAPRGLSIASLCCGIASFLGFGFFLLPQLAAVVLGHLALHREPGGKGLAIAGLVLGYAAIAITLLVVVILGVAFANADFITR
ncbi:DUF4190 domain-containing protein [Arthrobacter sp. YAF16]|uniref:DUF4190 domain-containing protein n=1 Tax=Arthrobacter sp. YAF16 TaxID=3233076 RepID=UPI003F8EB3E0